MVNMENYRKFVGVLNTHSLRQKDTATEPELIMIASLEARALSPSMAKQTIQELISAGYLTRKGDYIRYANLYDPKRGMYVVKSKAGKVLKSKRAVTKSTRTVKYASPGHTVVGYAHRTLHITFPETDAEFRSRQKARRRRAARNRRTDDTILLERDESGNVSYVNSKGKARSDTARTRTDKGRKAIVRKRLSRDTYTVEDMRARLRDDHWEEVAGNKRWNYDDSATVREFNKYLKTHNRR